MSSETTSSELHVVFGTGALSQAVMRELLRRGKRVRAVNASGRGRVPAGVELKAGEAENLASTRAACQDASVVYQTETPPYAQWKKAYPALQKGIIEGAAWNKAKLVCAEGVEAYGPVDGRLTENLAYLAKTRTGKVRAQLSALVMDAHKAGKVRAAIGRAPDVFGPQVVEAAAYGGRVFYPALANQRVWVMGNVDEPHSFMFIDDFAKGLVTLGERDEALGQIWHVPCGPITTQRELLTLVFEAAGHGAPKFLEMPNSFVLGLGALMPAVRAMAEQLYQWDRPFAFDHSKFEQAFGADVTPHKEAIQKTVEWFKANPKKVD